MRQLFYLIMGERNSTMKSRVELLAPCGGYESFLAAVNAGADAVYLGGKAFGARAYAENFSEEELITVIRQAHLFGVKVYLTVNTLVKQRELFELCSYLSPLYSEGLDGVIVQDMGVLACLKRNFPGLKFHASTQMTITGAYGAAFLKELGCVRIVPARELSLTEIRAIKQEVPIEIEAFIHGAMCYCYSGQCLMSSMIGGRSGNRGRCAGPCRLPYRTAGKEGYFLSLKDMNTLEHIPELIEAGIDSFKIEGRMKKSEYVAGVVSVYRKYIDRYYKDGGFRTEQRDRDILSGLYLRSETGDGYYTKSRGKDMLTLKKPGYDEVDQELLGKLRERYIRELPKKRIRISVRCREGEPLCGEVCFTDRNTGKEVCLCVQGAAAERADRRAVSGEEMERQLIKTGGTPFEVEKCRVDVSENAFVPMSRVKELRREMLQKIYEYYGAGNIGEQEKRTGEEERMAGAQAKSGDVRESFSLTILVQTKEQFETVFPGMKKEEYLILDADLLLEDKEIQGKLQDSGAHWGIRCPVILRKSDEGFLRDLQRIIEKGNPEIIYCATVDVFAWVRSISYRGQIAGESSLYAWNSEAVSFWGKEMSRVSIPLELDSREIRELCGAVDQAVCLETAVYGRTAFMVSANCIKLSAGMCDRDRKRYAELTDRMGNVFPVYTNCSHCYNIIYNYLPYACHDSLWMLFQDGIRAFRIELTTESGTEAGEVVQTFRKLSASIWKGKKSGREKGKIAGMETTQGRFRRSVE